MRPGLRLSVEDAPSRDDLERVPDALESFNDARWPGHQPYQPLGVFVRDGATLLAGLAGGTYGGWLFVRHFWVSEALRGQGTGRAMLEAAERRAEQRGCHGAWLDTFGFQAPGFYRKLGYEQFAALEWAPGLTRHFFRKALRPAPVPASSGAPGPDQPSS